MKINAIVSSVLCLAATQLVAADNTVTSTFTHTVTKTLVRVSTETPGASASVSSYVIPSSSATPSSTFMVSSSAAATSTPAASTPSASAVAQHSGAGSVADVSMPVALVAGSVALLLGAAL
ncbi:hypothetical protein CDV55_109168 [Aspergillus turcosus]|uniref:Uncharacterized protein n=1 Tax=Aspergillus turcosus TaxID=1245748 RepID=A0A229YYJ3_9EURO|nr:hypothetical protein CDV55_109168 [Aspergillus turcosus]RLL96524.1 hypothetical protein CFD26_106394 [Aspergillus turcosus]